MANGKSLLRIAELSAAARLVHQPIPRWPDRLHLVGPVNYRANASTVRYWRSVAESDY